MQHVYFKILFKIPIFKYFLYILYMLYQNHFKVYMYNFNTVINDFT